MVRFMVARQNIINLQTFDSVKCSVGNFKNGLVAHIDTESSCSLCSKRRCDIQKLKQRQYQCCKK